MKSGNVIIYQSPDGQASIDVTLDHDTVWLTQTQIIELFGSSKANISEHIKNILVFNELDKESTVRKIRTVRQEGKRQVVRELEHYNLDMIISLSTFFRQQHIHIPNKKKNPTFRPGSFVVCTDDLKIQMSVYYRAGSLPA